MSPAFFQRLKSFGEKLCEIRAAMPPRETKVGLMTLKNFNGGIRS